MKKIGKKGGALVLALVLFCTLFLAACGASSAKNSEVYPIAPGEDLTISGAADRDYMGEGGVEAAEPMAAKPGESGGIRPGADVKVIFSANINLESTDFDAATASLKKRVSEIGGYFEQESLDNGGTYRYASYTVRVPVEKFESFCATVGDLGQVNGMNVYAEDVGESYYDTESRLKTQQTKLERLQTLLSEATNMEDIITIESAISDTELYIENLSGTLRRYDSLIGFSTINISLREVYKLSGIDEPAIGFGAKLAAAFKSGVSSFTDGVQDFIIGFASNWIEWLIFIAIVIIVVRLIIRARKRAKSGAPVKKWGKRFKEEPDIELSGTPEETNGKTNE